MPFSTYLQADNEGATATDYTYEDADRANMLGIDSSTSVQFQIPQFMLNGPPPLAMGGGAEVVSAGMFNDSATITSSWFSNNGFSTKSFEDRRVVHVNRSVALY